MLGAIGRAMDEKNNTDNIRPYRYRWHMVKRGPAKGKWIRVKVYRTPWYLIYHPIRYRRSPTAGTKSKWG